MKKGNNIFSGITMCSTKPTYPSNGDVYFDVELGCMFIFNSNNWIVIDNSESGYNHISREKIIDDLLENDEFDPYQFGFKSNENPTNKYFFEYDDVRYEILKDRPQDNFYIIRKINENLNVHIYYRGKIPTNKFAVQLFVNMSFGFIPIVYREMKISDLLD